MAQTNAYAMVAAARAKEMPSRVLFGLFIALAAWVFHHGAWPLIWLGGVVVAQLVDLGMSSLIVRREAEPSPPMRALYFTSVLVNTVVYSSISIDLWFLGGLPGKLFAILLPAGALLNVALSMDRAPRILIAAWAPHVVYLLGLPILEGLLTREVDLIPAIFVSAGALLYVTHVVLAVRRIAQRAKEIHEARDIAEAERIKAQRASQAKSDFLATVSHEIRTPMNAVVAAAGLLGRTRLSDQQAKHVEMLTNGADVLMGLLNDVLDLSKIESGKLIIDQTEVALTKKLRASAELWSARAGERGVRLEFISADLPETIVTDSLRLQQIIFNLLSNAVKFTERGRIELRGGRCEGPAGAMLWIEVQDTGRGIDEDTASRIFDTFEQGSSGVTRQFGGTGLGLSISRRLAGLLGGDLTVSSVEGVGSTFRLQIPLIEGAPARIAEPDAVVVRSGAGARLLLAEDHEVNQRIVQLILEPLGFEVCIAGNGVEAVDAAHREVFDVIIMDMQMPVMGGVEAAHRIRSSAGLNMATPILAFTANAMEEHRAQWAAVGVDVFLTKPVNMQALVAAVCDAVALGEAERKVA